MTMHHRLLVCSIVAALSTPALAAGREPARDTGLHVTALGGVAMVASGPSGPATRVDARLAFATLPAGLVVSAGLSVRALYTHQEQNAPGALLETSALDLELAPSARLGLPIGRRLELHVELGAGLAHTRTGVTTEITYRGRASETGSRSTGLVRVGLGLELALGGSVRLALEPLSVGYRFDGSSDTALLGGVTFAL